MEIGTVAVELQDPVKKCVYGSSGIILDHKYVIITGNVLISLFHDNFYNNLHLIEPKKIHIFEEKEEAALKIISENCKVDDGKIIAFFVSENMKRTANRILQSWTIDHQSNNNTAQELRHVLSLFFVITVGTTDGNIPDFEKRLLKWADLIKFEEIHQLDEIFVKSVPFGNRFFHDSYSRGIVSNILGDNFCLVVSDCPVTPGSEGSPVYKIDNNVPFGIVIASSCWWRGDWTGLTLIIDIKSIFQELFSCYYQETKNLSSNNNYYLTEYVQKSFIQIYCGSQWGTAIVINTELGLLLTNSHVVDSNNKIKLFWNGNSDTGTVIYKSPSDEIYDLALIKCKNNEFLQFHNLKPIKISQKEPSIGEEVYSVGFAIFNKTINGSPSVSKGFIMQSDKSMMKTTCCVNSGMSGGAILNNFGELLGIIVCNARVIENVYPRFNMATPYSAIRCTIQEYIKSGDSKVLQKFWVDDPKLTSPWKRLQAKL